MAVGNLVGKHCTVQAPGGADKATRWGGWGYGGLLLETANEMAVDVFL